MSIRRAAEKHADLGVKEMGEREGENAEHRLGSLHILLSHSKPPVPSTEKEPVASLPGHTQI